MLGLYNLNSRYYDPETCRFISPDVISIIDEIIPALYHPKKPSFIKFLEDYLSNMKKWFSPLWRI